MNDWEHLTKHAILGTGGQAFSLPQSPLSFLWAQLETKEPAEKLLHSAALLTEYRRVGWQLPTSEKQSIASSPPETLPLCTPKAVEYLRTILREEDREIQKALLGEWLRLAQAAKQRAPFEVLPVLLDKCKPNKHLHKYLSETIGQRGHWLAKRNPDWQSIADVQTFRTSEVQDSEIWETGSFEARLAYLQQCRATEPSKAQELLAGSWQTEAAQARQAFLATFWTQLSLEDEDFLESCFNDRSQIVRQLAAQMLGSLADSRFLTQILERLSGYISVKQGRIKQTLEINLPSKYDKAWAREGIKEKPPSYLKVGSKAGWLYQMLLLVRPSFWLAHLGLSPETYLKMLRKTDFADTLYNALTTATKVHKDNSLVAMLVRQSKKIEVVLNTLADLAEALPDNEREIILQESLKNKTFSTWTQINQVVDLFPNGMSSNLSKILIDNSQPLLLKKQQQGFYYSHYALNSLAVVLAPSCYQELSTTLGKWMQSNTEPHPATENFLKIYGFRYQMTQEFA